MTILRSLEAALLRRHPVGDGWASRTLDAAVHRVVLWMVAVLQVVMAAVALIVVGVTGPGAALAAGCLVIGAVALVAVRRHALVFPLLFALHLLAVPSFLASGDVGSPLAFATCWLINIGSCASGFLVRHRGVYAVAVIPTLVVPASVVLLLPTWGWDLPVATFVTQLSILVVVRSGMATLLRFGRGADEGTAAAERAIRDVEIVRSASRRIAEDARLLHDTAINTLGAIANGGVGVDDVDQVRRQCAHDVERLSALREASEEAPASLIEVFGPSRLPIRRSGLDDGDLLAIEQQLPATAIRSLVGAAREAVTNAAKHSGAELVDVGVVCDGRWLELTVRDDGVGFDGRIEPTRGLAHSVFARAEAGGVLAELRTAPGEGTEIRLRAALVTGDAQAAAPAVAVPAGDVTTVVGQLHRSAGSLWGAGVTVVSVVLTAIGGTDLHLALLPMVALMAACWGVVVLVQRRSAPGTPPPLLLLLLLAAGAPAVFALSAVAVGFGGVGAVHWQALAATGPFVLLASFRPRPAVLRAALAVWIAVVAAIAASVLLGEPGSALIVVVAGCVGVGFALAWNAFQDAVARVGEHAARDQQREFAARLGAETATAAQDTFRRWLDAGLDPAIGLLRRIAEGAAAPGEEATRAACDREEAYLRQLILVGPELIRLGGAVMPALAAARSRGVLLALRLGERDASDESTAGTVGRLLRDAVESVGALGTGTLTATVFPVEGGLQLTLVGPHPALTAVGDDVDAGAAALRRGRAGESDLLEVVLAGHAA